MEEATGTPPKVSRVKGKTLPWTITQGDQVIKLDDKTARIMLNMMTVLAHGSD